MMSRKVSTGSAVRSALVIYAVLTVSLVTLAYQIGHAVVVLCA